MPRVFCGANQSGSRTRNMLRQVCSLLTLSYATVVMAVLVSLVGTAAGLPVCNVTVAHSDVNDVRNCTWPTAPSGRLVAVNTTWYFLGVVFPNTLRANEAAVLLASGARVVMDSCVNVTVAFANYTNITLKLNSSSMSVRYRSLSSSQIQEPLAAVEGNLSVAITNCSVTGPLLMIEGTGREQVFNVSLFMSSSTVYCDDTMDIEDQCFLLRLDNLSLASDVMCALENVAYHTVGSRETTICDLENVGYAHNVAARMHASNVTVELGSASATDETVVVQFFRAFVGSISGDLDVVVTASHVAVACGSIAARPFLWKASSYLIRLGPLQSTERSVNVDHNSSVALRVTESKLLLASVTRSVVIESRKLNVSHGSLFSVAVTYTTAVLSANSSALFRLDPKDLDLEGDGVRQCALVHFECTECYRVDLTLRNLSVTTFIVLDNAPNQSQTLLGPHGGDVLLVLSSISCFVFVAGAVRNADMHVSSCSLNSAIKQTSAHPLAFLSHACITSAAVVSSSVVMSSLKLHVLNCTVTMHTSVAVRPLTATESAATRRFLERFGNDAVSATSGLGALSSVAAVVVASVAADTSTGASISAKDSGISVLHSQLLIPSGSSFNGSVGEWRATVMLADLQGMLSRLGQTNAFVRQTFSRYTARNGHDRNSGGRSSRFALRLSISQLLTMQSVSMNCNMSLVLNASIANNLTAQQVFLSAVVIVFNASIEEHSSVTVMDSRLVVNDAGASATAVVALVASELNHASLFVGAVASSVGYGARGAWIGAPVITMADTHVVNGSYIGLLPDHDYATGCSDRVDCGIDAAVGRFSLVRYTGTGSTLARSVLDMSGVRVTTPSSLPVGSLAALVLLDDVVVVGIGLRVLAKCSTWDGDAISKVSQVVALASHTGVTKDAEVDFLCTATAQLDTTSLSRTLSQSSTLSALVSRSILPFSVSATPRMEVPSGDPLATVVTQTLYEASKTAYSDVDLNCSASASSSASRLLTRRSSNWTTPDSSFSSSSHTMRSRTLPPHFIPDRDSFITPSFESSITSAASVIGIIGSAAVDPSAAADVQLLAGLLGSPCLQRGGSDDSISRYLLSPFADADSRIAVVLGNIGLVVAVLVAQGAAASYFTSGNAPGCKGHWRLVVAALTQIRTAAKNAAVVRAQLPNWAVHAALFLLPGVAQGAVLSMSTGAAGIGGGVVGAAWIVCILAAVFPLWLWQIEAGKLAVFARYPYAAEAVVRAPAARYSDAKRCETRTAAPCSDSPVATPYRLPRWLLPMGTWGPDAVRTCWGKVFATARPPWIRWLHADCVLKTTCMMIASAPNGSSSGVCAAAFGVVAALSYGVAVVLLVMQPLRCTASSVLRGLCSAASGTVAALLAALMLDATSKRLQESLSVMSVALSVLSVLSTLHTIIIALLSRELKTPASCNPALWDALASFETPTFSGQTPSVITSIIPEQLQKESCGVLVSEKTRDYHQRCERGIAKQQIGVSREARDIRWLLMMWSLRRPDSCEEQVSRLGVMVDLASSSKRKSD